MLDIPMNIPEEWRMIPDFPRYEVSNLGRVANRETDLLLTPNKTLQGDLKVGLYSYPETIEDIPQQKTRLVKVLVANAFVPGRTELFDTPILLDGDQEHPWAHNIMWRPRAFAWRYSAQFKRNILKHYLMGPIVELDPNWQPINAYDHIYEICVTNGLLFADVWRAIHEQTLVYPTQQRFAFHKV